MRPVDLVESLLGNSDEQVAITGATGWFGSVALSLVYEALGARAPEKVSAYASSAREVQTSDGRTVLVRPLSELVHQSPAPTTLLHFAFVTRDKVDSLGLDRYTRSNVGITAAVLAAIAAHRPRHVIVTSSGAVYSASGGLETDLQGHPYGTLKRIDEVLIRSATREVGGTCAIPRVFSVAGDRMARSGVYALGDMIEMAAMGGPINVRASTPVFRSYCGVDEVVALSLWSAMSGMEASFDTCGSVVELGDLALLIAQLHGLGDGAVHRVWDPASAPNRYVGDGRVMKTLASQADLDLQALPALVRQTSDWFSRSSAAHTRPLVETPALTIPTEQVGRS